MSPPPADPTRKSRHFLLIYRSKKLIKAAYPREQDVTSQFIVSFASKRQVAETSVEAAGDGDHVLATATSATGLLTQAIQLIQVCIYTPVPEYGMSKRVAFRRSIL